MDFTNNKIYEDMKEFMKEFEGEIPYTRFNLVAYAMGRYGCLTQEAYSCIQQLWKENLIED